MARLPPPWQNQNKCRAKRDRADLATPFTRARGRKTQGKKTQAVGASFSVQQCGRCAPSPRPEIPRIKSGASRLRRLGGGFRPAPKGRVDALPARAELPSPPKIRQAERSRGGGNGG